MTRVLSKNNLLPEITHNGIVPQIPNFSKSEHNLIKVIHFLMPKVPKIDKLIFRPSI